MSTFEIRPAKAADIPCLMSVVDGTELFPGEMLAGMMSPFLSGEGSDDIWLTCELNCEVIGFCYAAPEKLTDGTWNMLAIAVHPSCQGKGAGAAIVRHLELILRGHGHRVIVVDTSGTPEFARTRAFYRNNGYAEEARIRDFWANGNDKIVFWKRFA